jgi:hypothetical protein
MKKLLMCSVIAALVLTALAPLAQAKVDREPGGYMAFFVGCCWGLREGLEWNEGAGMHWREWAQIVPGMGIWAGIECAQGITAHEWAQKNGANWY